jgi:hypothetical protein
MNIPEYRVLLAVDIEDYSSRTDPEQRTLQTALDRMLNQAADAAELDRQTWERQNSGDGDYAMLPRSTDVASLMDAFLRELDGALGAFNRRRAEETWSRLRLRAAVHIGPIHLDGAMGWPGRHAVQPARLRDSEPLRTAMAAFPDADLGVIVSREIYNDYVSQGPGRPRPNEFRPVLVTVKRQEYLAYLYMPRFDLEPVTALDQYTPALGTEGGHPRPAVPEPCASGATPSPQDAQVHSVPDGRVTNLSYGGDAFSGDKFTGDKHIH